jgi:dynein heavy chain
LIDRITSILYTNVARGLFEKDKLIYSFLIASSIQRNAKHIEEPIWNLLLRGPGVFTAEQLAARPDCPDPELVGAVAWDTLYTAELVSPHFTGIAAHVCSNWSVWREWADSEGPFEAALPGRYAETLSGFDRLVLVKVFRPELVQMSCADYIISDMGKFYAESPPASMEVIFEDLSKTTPLIFVLSAGADPTSQLQKFASDKGFRDETWRAVSLGQGQGPRAEGLIKRACLEGHWVLLQNCHLARSWMESLEQIVLHFSEQRDAIHEDFRLYLTSMPASYFPVSVLQNSVKLTTEPPRGMKANLRRTYANMSQRQLEDCAKPAIWRKLLFSFSFFHAVVQERRKFGPLGWNIRYEFNDSDLDTSFTMLKLFLEPQGDIPWDALLFVTGHINYGGRVTDDLDRRCLLTVLEKFCSSDCLNDGYKYSKSGIYQAPADGPLETYRTYIESLPMNDNPEIFGLHDNANITF